MKAHKKKKIFLIFLSLLLLLISCFSFFATINAAESKKYEMFNPTESYFYSTLKTETEKENYTKEVEHNNQILKTQPIIYLTLTIASFIAAISILIYRNKISKVKIQ